METEPQQAFFVLIVRVRAAFVDIQKYRSFFSVLIVLQHLNDAILLRNEQAIGSVARVSDHDRSFEVQIRKGALRANRNRSLLHFFICADRR